MTAPANPFEQLAYNIALQIQDGMIVYVGTGLPMVGAILAKYTHAPHITLVYESGGQDPWEGPMPWSVGGAATYRRAPMSMEMSHSFAMAANGYVDIAFQGAAQIDMYGNLNTHFIGEGYHNYKVRLTGSGGGNDLSSLTEHLVLVGLQDPTKFPAKLDFLTSPGFLNGGNSRKEAGLLGQGPQACISQIGVMDFEPESKRMRIKGLNPGLTVEIAQACTGFELLVPEKVEEIPAPSDDILKVLREEVDPHAIFIEFPPRVK
ncbi:MAG: CoA-transferase subunit beta [Syntrophomonadaceae bacterium]|nr:CoA-transferase [Bacillota bacterium]NLP25408.1 3-oxoacid CoA-transferase [Syntrophomonadaceae bacterium]